MLKRIREIIHRRYVRAVVASLAVVVGGCSIGAGLLEVRHEVSLAAVLRYFARSHHDGADLTRLLRNHATVAQLESLFAAASSASAGGMVYARSDSLEFHPCPTRGARAGHAASLDNREIFGRLAPLYLAGDLEGFIEGLHAPQVRERLLRLGVSPFELARLRIDSKSAQDATARSRVLRRAARQLVYFLPYRPQPFEPTLGDKLRFYDQWHPEGEFVGLFEILGLSLAAGVDDDYGHDMSRRSHYIVLFKRPDHRIAVFDYYRGSKRHYLVTPLQHPVGRTLFRVVPAV